MGVKVSAFSCKRESLTIRGLEFRPSGKGPFPIAIISHGIMATQVTNLTFVYAAQLAAQGYCAYCYDFCGGGIGSISDGKFSEMTVFTEKEDLKAVINYAKSKTYTSDNLTLMGCSQGGFVSSMVAADLGDEVSNLILFYPALCIPDDSYSGKMLFFKYDINNIPDKMRWGPVSLGGEYVRVAQSIKIFDIIPNYKGRVLIIHGLGDSIVPYKYAEKAYEVYKDAGADVNLIELPGAPHMFVGPPNWDAIDAVKKWLKGQKMVLEVDVKLTGCELEKFGGFINTLKMPFIGPIKSTYFDGQIQPGAADVQEWYGVLPLKLCATYTAKGKDYTGTDCSVSIVNRCDVIKDKGIVWRPEVKTDSAALDFLNKNEATAHFRIKFSLKNFGPRIRIFVKDK